MSNPDFESEELNKLLQRRINRSRGKWLPLLNEYNLDELSEKYPAVKEKLEELELLLKLCR